MSKVILSSIGGVLAVGIAVFFLAHDDETPVAPADSTSPASIENSGARTVILDAPISAPTAPTGDTQSSSSTTLIAIPVPPAFDHVPEEEKFWHHATWKEWHGKLELEPIDPAWSSSAERAIWDAINKNADLTRYGTPVVSCRTTICEVQLLAYGENSIDEGKWSTHFGTVVKNLMGDFALEEFSVAVENGAAAMVVFLSKKK
jgi:hypothetical protein